MAFNIADLFEHSVDAVPDRTAVVCGDRRLTYAELEARVNRLAHHLAGNGIGPGDHVGIYSLNSVEYVEAMLAAYKLRAVPINVNWRYVEDELRYLFDNADLAGLVHQPEFSSRVAAVRPSVPKLRHVLVTGDEYDAALAGCSPERDFAPRSGDDLYILYTGGTTGMPKGVMWRHEDVIRVLGGGIDFATGEPVPDDGFLARKAAASEPGTSIVIAPLMHGAGQWGTCNGLFNGNAVVLLPRFDPHETWRTIEREKVNTLSITGDAMARPLIEALAEGSYDTSSLFVVSSTAAVFSPSVKAQYTELLPHVIITEAVGSTETGFNGNALLAAGGAGQSEGLVTITMGPGTVVLDDDNRPVRPGSGVVGRMARSGHVPLGYYKDPVKSAATFVEVDGVRYSMPGDFATVNADGTMTLLGRGSVCINSGGEKIYPEEVEGALKAHPAVFDVLVVGVHDDRWGQRVAAVVEARPGMSVTLDELSEHCHSLLAGYKCPRELHVVDRVQRHPSGKPDYPWAKALVEKAATAGAG